MSQISWLKKGKENVKQEIQKWPEWKKVAVSETTVIFREKQELPSGNMSLVRKTTDSKNS